MGSNQNAKHVIGLFFMAIIKCFANHLFHFMKRHCFLYRKSTKEFVNYLISLVCDFINYLNYYLKVVIYYLFIIIKHFDYILFD